MAMRLAIVGAGPKAAAIVARAAILRDVLVGKKAPEILVFERESIGAAWSGEGRFSSGFLTLCTPGEKDVGYPYGDVAVLGPVSRPIGPELFAHFSWGAYLVSRGRFGDWVDRDRDHPSHARFADYLDWVFGQAMQDTIVAEVRRVWHSGDKWVLDYSKKGAERRVVVDGVVLTGAGKPRMVEGASSLPPGRVFDAENFWPARNLFLTDKKIEVAVAGDGGSAGAIVAWLADRFSETQSRIWSVSPMGTLFPRGDGHAERRWFTNPEDWELLDVAHRRKLIERTEAGVVSLRNKRTIDRSERVEYEHGKVRSVELDDDDKLALRIEYGASRSKPLSADYLINAIGFDSWSRLALVDHRAARALAGPRTDANGEALDKARVRAEMAILPDLSMSGSDRFPPGLHVPALADMARGPGMSNLGCLGLMAASILKPYVR
jgi:mycobactin lysine-N-oxygenase